MYGQPSYLGYGLANYGEQLQQTTETEMLGQDAGSNWFNTDLLASGVSSTAVSTGTDSYTQSRGQKTLPFIKGGATDAGVEKATGIKGLISVIQTQMGVSVTGTITTKQIEDYQKAQGLSVDGTIGQNTYKKLGLKPPYPKSQSSRGGSYTYDPKLDKAIGKTPWYKSKPVFYTVIGISFAFTAILLFTPKMKR